MAYQSSIVHVGNIALGGSNSIRVQSMTTTDTMDTASTVDQIKELVMAGCDFVRITTRNIREAENLIVIKNDLKKAGIEIPLIADVHFNPRVAEVAARIVEKVRINPGNYIDETPYSHSDIFSDDSNILEKLNRNIEPLLKICKYHGTVIRIGVNHGSMSGRMLYKYGNTPRGMVESIMEFVHVCQLNDFHSLVLSLKASSVITMTEANMLLVKRLLGVGLAYPIHLGVTEAGSGEDARIKSAAGIGYLLAHNIGDTIRVSLSENPVSEVPVAKQIVNLCGKRINLAKNMIPEVKSIVKTDSMNRFPVVITSDYSAFSDLNMDEAHEGSSCPKGDTLMIHKFNYPGLSYNDLIIRAAVEVTVNFLNNQVNGIWLNNKGKTSSDKIANIALNILQVLGLRIFKTEYIACPTCGRSTIDVIKRLDDLKNSTSHLPGLKIAVMGCVVNGPGEMMGADYGCVGSKKGMVNIYKGDKIIYKNVPEEKVTNTLVELIKKNGDWINNLQKTVKC